MNQQPANAGTPEPMVLVLDAMGVIYFNGDDVAELLCPFIQERTGECDRSRIDSVYREASLGCLSAGEFWEAVNLEPLVEDDYLQRHRLSSGLIEFLAAPPLELSGIWCLSNDVSQWSRNLRDRFALDQYFDGFVISGDVGSRKPDPAIFQRLLAEIGVEPHRILFVDDREPNLDAARHFGMRTILFAPGGATLHGRHRLANDFHELRNLISSDKER